MPDAHGERECTMNNIWPIPDELLQVSFLKKTRARTQRIAFYTFWWRWGQWCIWTGLSCAYDYSWKEERKPAPKVRIPIVFSWGFTTTSPRTSLSYWRSTHCLFSKIFLVLKKQLFICVSIYASLLQMVSQENSNGWWRHNMETNPGFGLWRTGTDFYYSCRSR